MINLPKCDLCVHEEICKITKQLNAVKDKIKELKLDDDIPVGVSMDLDCSYYKHEMHEYVC
jgi:hypothetical protein